MKFLNIIVFLLCVSAISAKEYLSIVKNLDSYASQFSTIEKEDNNYILLTNDEGIASLKSLGFSVHIADSNPQSKEYFLVYPQTTDDNISKEAIKRQCDVLATFKHSLLVRGTAESLHKVEEIPIALNKLEYTPMKFSSPKLERPISIPTTRTPLITRMVNAVEKDSLRWNVKKLQYFGTRHATSDQNSEEVCPWLFQKLYDLGCDTVYYQNFNFRYGPNVVGIKKGKVDSSITTYCMIGAHLDSYSKMSSLYSAPGADDNASGTAAVLEAARVLKDYNFEYTIKFSCWNAEEVGLIGSEAMAQEADDNGHTIIGGVINFDMIGRTTPENDYLQITGPSEITGGQELTDKFTANAKLYSNLKFSSTVNNTSKSSDHASFWRHNILAVYGIESDHTNNEVMHTTFDTLDNPNGYNDSEFHTEVVKAGIAALADMAKPIADSTNTKNVAASNNYAIQYSNKNIFLNLPRESSNRLTLRIYNPSGKCIYTTNVKTQKTNITIPINKKLESNGVYIANITSPTFSQSVKILSW